MNETNLETVVSCQNDLNELNFNETDDASQMGISLDRANL